MTVLSSTILEIREKYGLEVASDMERILDKVMKDEVLPDLVQLQESLLSILGVVRQDMIPATDVQRKSFKELLREVKARRKLMLLYKSTPSVIMLEPQIIEEIEEKVSSMIAALHWKADEGRGVSPDEFWNAMEKAENKVW